MLSYEHLTEGGFAYPKSIKRRKAMKLRCVKNVQDRVIGRDYLVSKEYELEDDRQETPIMHCSWAG